MSEDNNLILQVIWEIYAAATARGYLEGDFNKFYYKFTAISL